MNTFIEELKLITPPPPVEMHIKKTGTYITSFLQLNTQLVTLI